MQSSVLLVQPSHWLKLTKHTQIVYHHPIPYTLFVATYKSHVELIYDSGTGDVEFVYIL